MLCSARETVRVIARQADLQFLPESAGAERQPHARNIVQEHRSLAFEFRLSELALRMRLKLHSQRRLAYISIGRGAKTV